MASLDRVSKDAYKLFESDEHIRDLERAYAAEKSYLAALRYANALLRLGRKTEAVQFTGSVLFDPASHRPHPHMNHASAVGEGEHGYSALRDIWEHTRTDFEKKIISWMHHEQLDSYVRWRTNPAFGDREPVFDDVEKLIRAQGFEHLTEPYFRVTPASFTPVTGYGQLVLCSMPYRRDDTRRTAWGVNAWFVHAWFVRYGSVDQAMFFYARGTQNYGNWFALSTRVLM